MAFFGEQLPDTKIVLRSQIAGSGRVPGADDPLRDPGGSTVLLGIWARLEALILLGFVATLLAHGFGGLSSTADSSGSLEHLAIVGRFLLILSRGAGSLSIDALIGSR
jgi:hypothetical protein